LIGPIQTDKQAKKADDLPAFAEMSAKLG